MKVIKSVEVLEVSDQRGHMVDVAHHGKNGLHELRNPGEPFLEQQYMEVETCYGHHYRDDRTGQDEWIALTKNARKALGFPFNQLELSLQREERLLRAKLAFEKSVALRYERVRNATLRERLRYLFKREIVK